MAIALDHNHTINLKKGFQLGHIEALFADSKDFVLQDICQLDSFAKSPSEIGFESRGFVR
jgi:hypothetical protein